MPVINNNYKGDKKILDNKSGVATIITLCTLGSHTLDGEDVVLTGAGAPVIRKKSLSVTTEKQGAEKYQHPQSSMDCQCFYVHNVTARQYLTTLFPGCKLRNITIIQVTVYRKAVLLSSVCYNSLTFLKQNIHSTHS